MSRLSVRGIDENVLENFKESVREKYGKLHTVFGLEVEKALELYLAGLPQTPDTHTHEKKEENVQEKGSPGQKSKINIPSSTMVGKTRIDRINNVGGMLMNGTAEITEKGLRRFIETQGVGDDRVIESYIKTMKRKGWLVSGIEKKNTELVVLRSTISEALDIPLPQEILASMAAGWEIPGQVEGNGGRH